jgi:hypothetical protein
MAKIKSNYIIGDFVAGTEISARYYNKCDATMLKAEVLDIEIRTKSVMLIIKILQHTNKEYIGKKYNVNQAYMQKISNKAGMVYDIEGNLSKEEDTVKIQGRVYTKDVNAFCIKAKWYSKNSDKICIDEYTGKYDLINELFHGNVGKNKKGYFSRKAPFVSCKDTGEVYMSNEVAELNGLKECIFDGFFYKDISKMPKGKVAYNRSTDEFANLYVNKDVRAKLGIKDMDLGESSPTFRITGGYKATFGVEIETSTGRLPINVVKDRKLNVKCMHDGSINGGEYVTGILKGDKGFENLHKICSELSKRCGLDNAAGLHVHIGGIEYDKDFIVFAYMLAKLMETEIQSMLPSTRRGTSNEKWGKDGKSFKDYCRNLNDIDFTEFYKDIDTMTLDLWNHYIEKYYSIIYKRLSGGKEAGKSKPMSTSHPKISGTNRWISERYCWFNLLPCIFTRIRSDDTSRIPSAFDDMIKTKEKINYDNQTIEFRNHPGSLNYDKIKNWVLICMAFTKFVQSNKKDILKAYGSGKSITLESIVISFFDKSPEKAEALNDYIAKRKTKFAKATKKSFEGDDLETKEKTLKELCA